MALQVSEVARLAGISIRTLHHYDEIGLVRPSTRTDAGYRLYAPADLERLQQVLFFRELDFPLPEIRRLLDDPEFDVITALRMQRRLLGERETRLRALIVSVDAALAAHTRGVPMSDEQRFEGWEDFDPARFEDETHERWGDTREYAESRRRTRAYQKEDWARIKLEMDAILADLARLAAAGEPATGEHAMAVAERHRDHIERWFYPCPPGMHRALGELVANDPRFAEGLERHGPGLAAYARDAWRANAERSRG